MGTDAQIWTPGGEQGPAGPAGPQGPAGPNIELRTNDTHVQWRVEGDVDWIDLEPLANLIGPAGPTGATGPRGDIGETGDNIELQTSATHIQWRVVGSATWINLVALADITGDPGASSTILRSTGVPDDSLDGVDGDYYIQEDEVDFGVVLYGPKTAGAWPTNFIPLSGPEGEPSEKVVLNGAGAPDDSVGTNGDFFIDTTAYDLYGPKAGGAWPTPPVSLIGPQGPAGNELLAQYGQINATNNTTALSLTAATDPTLVDSADYTQITGIWDAVPHGENNGVTQQTNSFTINKTGVYKIQVWASVVSDSNNTTVAVKFGVNGVISLVRRPRVRLPNAGNPGQLAAHGFVELADGDVITLWNASTVTANITWADVVFSVNEFVSTDAAGGFGASTFLDLSDTPSDYTGFAGQPLIVNGTADGIEFSSSNFVFESRTLTAAGGLTGGGDLSLNRSFALGTPSTLSGATTNSVTTDSHTHAVNSTASRSDPSTSTLLQAKAMDDHVGSGDHDARYAQLAAANTFTSTQAIESATPDLVFSETDTTDQNWRMALASGVLSIQTINDAFVFIAHVLRLTHGGGMQVGAPPGGDQGAGTVNATGLYENGESALIENTSGVVIQQAFASTGAVVSTTSTIGYDDTIPQITEGAEAISIAFTPKRSDSRIRITSLLQLRADTANRARLAAIFRSGVSDALGVSGSYSSTESGGTAFDGVVTIADISSPGVSSQTFSVRFAGQSAGTMYLNADDTGSRRFGGAYASTLAIVEYMP